MSINRTFGVVELRRYVTYSGQRDALIALFEKEFIESQEERGMVPIGQFRDCAVEDSFVWFRGFQSMDARRRALEDFYTSPAWLDHRSAANATMISSDNVLLLRNARPGSGFDVRGLRRPAGGNSSTRTRRRVATSIFMLSQPADQALVTAFEERVLPEIRRYARLIAYLVTEERRNDYPRLPVRESEYAFVVVGVCPNDQAVDAWMRAFADNWRSDALHTQVRSSEMLRLEPSRRSLLR